MVHRPLAVPCICVSSAWFNLVLDGDMPIHEQFWESVGQIIKRQKDPVKDLFTPVKDRNTHAHPSYDTSPTRK